MSPPPPASDRPDAPGDGSSPPEPPAGSSGGPPPGAAERPADGEPAGGMRTTREEDTADLARGAGVNYLGFVARLGSRVPFLFLAGRLYGEALFGTYTFVTTVAETVAAVSMFGMKRSFFKFMSEARDEGRPLAEPIAHGVALALLLGVLLTLGVAGGAAPLARLFGMPGSADDLLLVAVSIPLIVLSDILLVAIRYTRQMRFEVYARSIAEPVTLTVAVAAFHLLGLRELGLVYGYVASLAAAAAVSAWFFVRIFPLAETLRAPLRRERLRELVSFSGPTAGYTLMDILFKRIDILLVSYFLSPAAVGVYGMAREISTVTKKIRSGFERILPAVFSESVTAANLRRGEDQLSTVSRWILTAQVAVILLFAFFAEDLLAFIGGGAATGATAAFAGGATILLLLISGDAVRGALGMSELPFVYLRPVANVWFGAGMLLLGLLGHVLLIPWLGGEGAALSILVTMALVNGARVTAARRMFGLTMVRASFLKPLAAAVPPAGLVVALRLFLPVPELVFLGVGVPVLLAGYLATLYALGLEPEDRDQLQRLRARIG